jgi:putative colanic acid biosysnthesis UDP-glucose lipid carrier transferase
MEDKYYSRFVKVLIFIIDFYIIQVVFTLAKAFDLAEGISDFKYTALFLVFSLIWIIAGFINEIYRINKFSILRSIGKQLISTLFVHITLLLAILVSVQSFQIGIRFFVFTYVTTTVLIIAARITFKLIGKYFEFSGFDQRNVIIIGATRSGKELFNFFNAQDYPRYHFKGFFDDCPDTSLIDPRLIKGCINKVPEYCLSENIEEIYYALPLHNERLIKNLAKFSDDHYIYLRIVPDFGTVVTENHHVFIFNSTPVITTRNEPLGIAINAALKRIFDIAFSLFVIMTVLLVCVPVIALLIRLESKGPVIFKQLRRGKKNKLFECYKFRTMHVNDTPDQQATKNDPRITRVGRYLRKYNLDELPQFVNVLLGNMSVVGPRPHISKQDEYARIIKKYKVRHFVTPGITGYAQVNGYRGETKEVALMEKRVEYDVKYMENWSFALDLKIICLTVLNMFRGEKTAF